MELKEHLVQLANKSLPSQDYYLVDIILKGNNLNRKVIILLDGDNGVSIDSCAKVSRAVGAELEENDPFPGKYTLEVSSAGLDHPLTLKRQYSSRVGKTLKLILANDQEFKGVLMEVKEEEIIIDKIKKVKNKQTTELTSVPLAEIKKALVQVSFK
ncbi:MAG: ribosome maturation factor RimP [Bacteroidota bacterium]